jgi:hypothetical protein
MTDTDTYRLLGISSGEYYRRIEALMNDTGRYRFHELQSNKNPGFVITGSHPVPTTIRVEASNAN